MRWTRGLLRVGLVLTLCAGCRPDQFPAYTSDGKTVVAISGQDVWTCDVKTGAARAHPLGDGWRAQGGTDLAGQLWVSYSKPKGDDGKSERTARRFDPSTGKLIPAPEGIDGKDLARNTFPASHKGKKCLFLRVDNDKVKVLSVPELKEVATISGADRWPAGNHWWVQVVETKTDDGEGSIDRVDVYDPRARKVCTVSGEAVKKANVDGDSLQYAHVNDDGKRLLLAFGGRDLIKRFGVFDATNGKGLWSGKTGDVLAGTPLLKSGELWTIEMEVSKATATAPANDSERPDLLALVRYSPGKGKDADKATREVIMTCPARLDYTEDHYTRSPDGSQFVVQQVGVLGSRLRFIPIGKTATAKDVRTVKLFPPR